MRLLWVVGARDAFGPDGHFPAGCTRSKKPPPPWLSVVGLLAQAGGLTHDLGKSGNFFADKLARAVNGGPPEADPIRHEWISMCLLQLRRRGLDWPAAWDALTHKSSITEPPGLDELCASGLDGPERALDYLVATHHRLFGPEKDASSPTSERHVADGNRARELVQAGALPDDLHALIDRIQARLALKAEGRGTVFWRAAAIFARAALILADHEVSSSPCPPSVPRCAPYANTKNGDFDQPLDWHLRRVSERAADFAWRIASLRLSGLTAETVEHILSPCDERGRFAWQNRAVAAVTSLRTRSESGMLIFNIAATGAGKTIANAKLACSVSSRPRFAVALNLRTLTLQTGDALAKDLGLGPDELATVIGDRVTAKLHASSALDDPLHAGAFETEGPPTEYDANGGEVELPEWMAVLTKRRPSLRSVIGAPVLASTIDYLINAAEPGRQGHHVSSLLRMVDSDLVLDEVDSYEPSALVAVLRLIQVVGLMGRTVICSSATLPRPIAEAVFRAFRSGVAMRCALEDRALRFGIAIVDDNTPPSAFQSDEPFSDRYDDHVKRLLELPRRSVRSAYVRAMNANGPHSFSTAVIEAITGLHQNHAWVGPEGRRISFGLVRVAKISTAITLAREIAVAIPHGRVACYHARDFRIQRYMKEKRLDFLLNRKRGNSHILEDEEIKTLVSASASPDVPFIVVATPVEEVGRDHDFDWGVIEPSSAHSIVQTAGRINRHRLDEIDSPNVAILQYNFCRLEKGPNAPCFYWPGLESQSHSHRYSSSDLVKLLEDADLDALDARLRLGGGRMAQDEDAILTNRLKTPLEVLEAGASSPARWMTHSFYTTNSLRERSRREAWRAECVDGFWLFKRQAREGEKEPWVIRNIDHEEPRQPNDWLVWDLQQLQEFGETMGVTAEDGLEVQLSLRRDSSPLRWDRSFGFTLG